MILRRFRSKWNICDFRQSASLCISFTKQPALYQLALQSKRGWTDVPYTAMGVFNNVMPAPPNTFKEWLCLCWWVKLLSAPNESLLAESWRTQSFACPMIIFESLIAGTALCVCNWMYDILQVQLHIPNWHVFKLLFIQIIWVFLSLKRWWYFIVGRE